MRRITKHKTAYDEMMGGEPASKVADKYWESFCNTAKINAPRGKGLPSGKHDGTTVDSYPLSKAERIVECWQWIKEQCRPPVQENKPTEADQKLIEMNLLERQPAVCHPSRPDWLRAWTYDLGCSLSSFVGLLCMGTISREGFLEWITRQTSPLSDRQIGEIARAAIKAAEEAYLQIETRRLKEDA